MDYVVFSKDRACQLDLFIRCALDHFPTDNMYVLYTYSSDSFQKGYDKLAGKNYPGVNLVLESKFKTDLVNIFHKLKGDYFISFADDDCIVKKIDLSEAFDFFKDERFQCFSFKFSDTITRNSVSQTPMKLPDFIRHDNFLMWDWTKQNPQQDWGYPMAFTGTMFRKGDIQPYITDLSYRNSASLEGASNYKRDYNKPLMASFNGTKAICLPINAVITGPDNPRGIISQKELNQRYLDGFAIDKQFIYDLDYNKSFFVYTNKLKYREPISQEQIEKFAAQEEQWFTYKKFYSFISSYQSFTKFAEVGCWKGHSISFLANLLRDRSNVEIYAIDLFDNRYNNEDYTKIEDAKTQLKNIYTMYNYNLKRINVRHLIKDIQGISWEVAAQFPDAYFDFIYIDADHHAPAVRKDIEAWLPKVKKNGILAGHDYAAKSGVPAVVDEIFDRDRLVIYPEQQVWSVIIE